MALPKIEQPLFSTVIPSTGEKTKFRPMLVKEEKILLVAQESKDPDQIINALKQIIEGCVLGINVSELAIFDLEYLLLKIRSKSVDSVIEFSINDPDTEEQVKLKLDLETIEVQKNADHTKIIKVTDDVQIVMKYPTVDMVKNANPDTKNSTNTFEIMTKCIESVVQGEEVYKMDDFSESDQQEFVESLDSKTLVKIKNFFDTMPKLSHTFHYTNKNNEDKKYVLEGLESFFI